MDGRYRLDNLLGKGSFCSVIAAYDVTAKQKCVLKRPVMPSGTRAGSTEPEQLAHMLRECKVLRLFTTNGADTTLPRLYDATHTIKSDMPYLLMLPVGIPLVEAVSGVSKPNRKKMAQVMFDHCSEALAAALSLNVCHSDLGPDNIVVSGEKFIVVDWGLARAPNVAIHEYKGRLPFMSDRLVQYFADLDYGRIDATDVEPFLPQYDVDALTIVQYAVERGKPHLAVPWANEMGKGLIRRRKLFLECGDATATGL